MRNALQVIALKAVDAEELMEVILSTKPFDITYYAQTEARRNALVEVCQILDPTESALQSARITRAAFRYCVQQKPRG